MGSRRTQVIASWIILNLILAAIVVHRAAVADGPPDFDRLLRERPYAPLFTEVNDPRPIRSVNQLTGGALDSKLTDLTSWYSHFHSEGSNSWPFGTVSQGSSPTTLATKLAARGATVSNYRNGSYVSQASPGQVNWAEAAMLERRAPLSIATFWPGDWRTNGTSGTSGGARLTEDVSADARVIHIAGVAAADRPSGTPATWPFFASRGTGAAPGAYSANTHDVVSWIRVDDELMQVMDTPEASSGTIVLKVERGLWGSDAARHGADTRVMAPVYIGNKAAATSDAGLAGAPNLDSTQATLRYGIKIWEPAGAGFIADRIAQTFGPDFQGYNGVWLDVSSCFQYNNADAGGNPVFQWHDAHASKMTRDMWGAAQASKLDVLRARFPGVWLGGNSLSHVNACTWNLLGEAYDGGVLENYVRPSAPGFDWRSDMEQTFQIMTNDWPGLFWARWNRHGGDVPRYQRFAYGSFLLAYHDGANRALFGGPFGLQQPGQLFRWDLGAPVDRPTSLANLRLANGGYRREFAAASVIVNPTEQPITVTLERTFWDIARPDANGAPSATTTVTVAPRDAAFLLRSAGDTVDPGSEPEPTPTPTSDPEPVGDHPDAQISSPIQGANISAGEVEATGVASDDRAIESVRIWIHDATLDRWWHGPSDGWSRDTGWVAAELESPGAMNTRWSAAWTAPAATRFEITVVARDSGATDDTSPAKVSFTSGSDPAAPSPSTQPSSTPSSSPTPSVAPTPADAAISRPVDGATVRWRDPLLLRGTAVGDTVSAVELHLIDEAAGTSLTPDGGWGSGATVAAALGTPGADGRTPWSFTWNTPIRGRYRLVATAIDASGPDLSPAVVRFEVLARDRRAPRTTIMTRVARLGDADRPSARTISGVVRDRSGVRTVSVAIRSVAHDRWWAGRGRWVDDKRWRTARIRGERWFLRWRPEVGTYVVRVRSLDRAGNLGRSPTGRIVRVRLRA
jgi:hypothetical protein